MKTDYKILVKKSFYEILKINEISHNFPMHIHNRLCIGKINSGEKYLLINGQKNILKKNDLFYIPPYIPHSCYIKEGNTVSYTILCIDDIRKISKKMIINDILSSLIEIEDIYSLYKYAATIDNYVKSNNNKIINKLLKYIDENYTEQLSVDFLANKIGLNSFYLLHMFKEKVGISLHQFLIQTRIKKTKKFFLRENNILNIALNCGFYDQSHYIRNFKRYVGITPQKYFDAIKIL